MSTRIDHLGPRGKLLYMQGPPGCGKSTRAAELKAEYGDQCVVLCRDAFREMWHCLPLGTPEQEAAIRWCIDASAIELLRRGAIVVIDATNMHPSDAARWERIGAETGCPVRCIDLTEVGVDECIRRDLARRDSGGRYVGEAVIRAMVKRAGLPAE